MRIVVRTDGSEELGMGHVTRSVAVADELARLGADVAFGGASGMAAKYIVEHGHAAVWPNPDQIDVVLNDMPPNGSARNNWTTRQLFMTDLITGPETMPIRREVLRAGELRDDWRNYGVLVTAGWSDSWDLDDVMREQVNTGGAAEAMLVPTVPGSMIAAAARCSLAVTTMGMTAWELACMGVPMIVVAPTDQHFIDAQPLARAGAAVVLERALVYGSVSFRAKELLEDRARLRRMGEAGRALVDGRGARRVAEKIMEEAGRC